MTIIKKEDRIIYRAGKNKKVKFICLKNFLYFILFKYTRARARDYIIIF